MNKEENPERALFGYRNSFGPEFSTVIVAHESRADAAEILAHNLGAHIVLDDENIGAAANHIRAWQHHALTEGPAWRLVIEDDALPVDDFTNQLDQALITAPADIVSLYLGRQRPPQHQAAIKTAIDKAQTNNANWILSNQLYHAVAVAIHANRIPDMLTHMRTRALIPPDERITSWARTRRLPVAYIQPSLVDHNDTIPSIEKHRDGSPRRRGRTAWIAGTRTKWTNQTVTI